MMKTKLPITLLVLLFMPALALSATKDDSHMDWWRDARFGMSPDYDVSWMDLKRPDIPASECWTQHR